MRCAKQLLLIFVIASVFGLGSDLQTKASQLMEKVDAVKEKYHNYIKLFTPDKKLKNECARIQKEFTAIDEEIRQGNLSLVPENLARLDREIDLAFAAFRERRKNAPLALFFSLANLCSFDLNIPPLPVVFDLDSSIPAEKEKGSQDPCREEQEMFYKGYRAESEARFAEAIRHYLPFLDSDCAAGADGDHARKFIAGRRKFLMERVSQLAASGPSSTRTLEIPAVIAEVEVFAQNDPAWASPLLDILKHASAQLVPNDAPTARAADAAAKNEPQPFVGPAANERQIFPLTLDVWQSAWGDFSDIQVLLDYLRSNRIRQVNFNPGLGIDSKSWESSKKKLAELTRKVFNAGIERVNFLYAELGYPIKNYAQLLLENPSLKIDTIIDDSEFTDRNRAGFERNLAAVRKFGIRYGAFVTLESAGNSGVSDATRYWALDNADFPILMSYFSCDLDSQKAALKKYLDYADGKGRRGTVGVAILLGGKHVGRELSCEKLLSREQLQFFISQLHAWCLTHPSYGGLVLETDQRLPRWPVAIAEAEASQ